MFRRLAVAVLAITMASQLEAQVPRKGIAEVQPSPRGGFWGSMGFGAGMENVDLDGDRLGYSDRALAPHLQLPAGRDGEAGAAARR